MTDTSADQPVVIESPAEERARYFQLDSIFSPEVVCPDCYEALDLTAVSPLNGPDTLSLGDVVDAANAHVCAEEED